MTTDHPDIIELDRAISDAFDIAEARYLAEAANGADWLERYGELRRALAVALARNERDIR